MPIATAAETLEREFLEIRARILELAARFDRLDRSEGSVAGDPRLAQLRESIAELQTAQPGRAERVQLIFSRKYDKDWRKTLGVEK